MNKNKAVINLLFCSIIHGLNHYLVIFYKPIYPYMKDYFHLNNVGDLTTKLTIIYLGYGFSNFLAGVLSKKISLKLILFTGMLIMSLATIAVYFVNPGSFFLMTLLIFIMGLGGGTYHPAANTLITSTYEGNKGFAIGILSIGSAIGFIVAPFVGEYIGLKMIGFKNLFLISGMVSLLFSFLFLFFVTDNNAIYNLKAKTITKNDNKKNKIFIYIIILICIPVTLKELTSWSFYEITPFWVYSGYSSGITISFLQMMQFIPAFLVQPLTGKLCDYLKPIRIVIISFFLIAIGFILFAFHGLEIHIGLDQSFYSALEWLQQPSQVKHIWQVWYQAETELYYMESFYQ